MKSPSLIVGLSGILRSSKTGLPVVAVQKKEYLDKSTYQKRKYSDSRLLCEKFFGFTPSADRFSYDIKDITAQNDWIAIIHADGNGLGAVVQKVGGCLDDYKSFSLLLDKATKEAVQETFNEVAEKYSFGDKKRIPVRPVVLGGDDMTVICRGDMAVFLTSRFLAHFEDKTKSLSHILKKYSVFENSNDSLTACAGIAFIKSSYPFYYGYDLAEELCSRAKKDAKEGDILQKKIAPSCLMFHKVQDSFVTSYEEISRRELRTSDVSFEFGPYYLTAKDGRFSISELMELVGRLDGEEENILKNDVRQWLSLMHESSSSAAQKARRVRFLLPPGQILDDFNKMISENFMRKGVHVYPAYDVLSLRSIEMMTRKEK